MGVRHVHNWFTLTTDLIIHHSIPNIPNQITDNVCILGIVNETPNTPLLSQQCESLENVFQFSGNPHSSAMDLTLGRDKLTVPVPSSSFLLYCHLQEQVHRVRQKGP